MVGAHLRALIDLPETRPSRAEAVAACRHMARTHYENFTVISWMTPSWMRRHLAVLYAFCRTVDDVGDEPLSDSGEPASVQARLKLLDRFEGELDAAYRGQAHHPVLVALEETIERFDLPREPFARLIEANRIDQQITRYGSYDELLHYCTHSANPVGRLFLMLFGYRDDERFALSDATCTALQLANFWQDVRRDFEIGRIYLPQDDMARFDVTEDQLRADAASPQVRELMRFQVERARSLFAQGLPLIDRVRGHLQVDLALFSRGGLAILDKIEALGFDTISQRPEVGTREKVALLLGTLVSRRWQRWI